MPPDYAMSSPQLAPPATAGTAPHSRHGPTSAALFFSCSASSSYYYYSQGRLTIRLFRLIPLGKPAGRTLAECAIPSRRISTQRGCAPQGPRRPRVPSYPRGCL